jgi:hypothetical protein
LKRIRQHLTYANVMSTLFVFLLLAGGTAFAAQKLGKKTVGAKQLKTNAVTTPKIKKGAVTKAKIAAGAVDASKIAAGAVDASKIGAGAVDNSKIADNAVTGSKIADGSVSGSDINAASAPFSQVVSRMRTNALLPYTPAAAIPIGSYTQNAGEDNLLMASIDVQFAASCAPPRTAVSILLLDAANPAAPEAKDFLGIMSVEDKLGGEVTRRVDYGQFPGLGATFTKAGPLAPTTHTFTAYLASSACNTGSGINFAGAGVDVIGTK